MTNMTNGCKWAVGAAVSIGLAMAGSVQARVFILDDAYNPGEQVAVEFKGCPGTDTQLEKQWFKRSLLSSQEQMKILST